MGKKKKAHLVLGVVKLKPEVSCGVSGLAGDRGMGNLLGHRRARTKSEEFLLANYKN